MKSMLVAMALGFSSVASATDPAVRAIDACETRVAVVMRLESGSGPDEPIEEYTRAIVRYVCRVEEGYWAAKRAQEAGMRVKRLKERVREASK